MQWSWGCFVSIHQIVRMFWRGLGKLTVFSGRDSRSQFWPYALLLYLTISLTGMIPIAVELDLLTLSPQKAAERQWSSGAGANEIEALRQAADAFTADFIAVIYWLAATVSLTAALLASAVTRRLHDRNQPGTWGLIPLPLLGFTLYSMTRFLTTGNPDNFFAAFLCHFLNMAALAFLIIHLAGPGTPGPNRYGDDPAAP